MPPSLPVCKPTAGARKPLPPHPQISRGASSTLPNSIQGSNRRTRRTIRTNYLSRRRWGPYHSWSTEETAYSQGAAAKRATHTTSTIQCARAANTLAIETSISATPLLLLHASGVTAMSGATAEYRQGAEVAPEVSNTTEDCSDSPRVNLATLRVRRRSLLRIFSRL